MQRWKVEQREFAREIGEAVRPDLNGNQHRAVDDAEGFGRVISIAVDLLSERIVSDGEIAKMLESIQPESPDCMEAVITDVEEHEVLGIADRELFGLRKRSVSNRDRF